MCNNLRKDYYSLIDGQPFDFLDMQAKMVSESLKGIRYHWNKLPQHVRRQQPQPMHRTSTHVMFFDSIRANVTQYLIRRGRKNGEAEGDTVKIHVFMLRLAEVLISNADSFFSEDGELDLYAVGKFTHPIPAFQTDKHIEELSMFDNSPIIGSHSMAFVKTLLSSNNPYMWFVAYVIWANIDLRLIESKSGINIEVDRVLRDFVGVSRKSLNSENPTLFFKTIATILRTTVQCHVWVMTKPGWCSSPYTGSKAFISAHIDHVSDIYRNLTAGIAELNKVQLKSWHVGKPKCPFQSGHANVPYVIHPIRMYAENAQEIVINDVVPIAICSFVMDLSKTDVHLHQEYHDIIVLNLNMDKVDFSNMIDVITSAILIDYDHLPSNSWLLNVYNMPTADDSLTITQVNKTHRMTKGVKTDV